MASAADRGRLDFAYEYRGPLATTSVRQWVLEVGNIDRKIDRKLSRSDLELMHDYLIELVNRSTGKVMDATQRANRLFGQYLSSYSMDAKTRIPLSKLWVIRRYSDLERGERARELFRKSLRWD